MPPTGPDVIEFTDIYWKIHRDPVTLTDYAKPEFFRSKGNWIAFVPLLGEIYVSDTLGYLLFQQTYSQQINEKLIKDACLHAQLYNHHLFMFFNKSILRMDLENMSIDTLEFLSSHPLQKSDQVIFAGGSSLLINSRHSKTKSNSFYKVFLTDIDKGIDKLMFSLSIDSLPDPFLLVKPHKHGISSLIVNDSAILVHDLKGKQISRIGFPIPKEFKFHESPAYDLHEISSAFEKPASDRYLDFYLSDSCIFIHAEVYPEGNQGATTPKPYIYYYNFFTGQKILREASGGFKQFGENGTYFEIKSEGTNIYLKNMQLSDLFR